jgi:hypothetical protein
MPIARLSVYQLARASKQWFLGQTQCMSLWVYSRAVVCWVRDLYSLTTARWRLNEQPPLTGRGQGERDR